MKNSTIQDVADEAGVSITTVSRVINNNYPVKKETRARVEKAIGKLAFKPNILARGLIQKKTFTIGVLVPSITNLFFPAVVNGIQDYLDQKNYQIMLCDTGGKPENEALQLNKFLERQVDGIISIDPRTASIKDGSYANAAEQCPLVLINGYNEGVKLNFVLNDQITGAYEALEHLISLGHSDIAFVRGQNSYSYDLKEEAYRKTLLQCGIPFREEFLVVIENGNSIQTTDMAVAELQKTFSINNRPTAVFACNDWMGVGALHAAQKLGISVPQELSVIGYDNIVISELSMPKLTTVDQNMHRLGTTAAEQLFAIISGQQQGNKKIMMDTKLIIRDSCAKIKDA